MRIQELAKKYGVGTEELVTLLRNAGYDIDSRSTSVDYDMLTALDRHFSWSAEPAPKKSRARAKTKTKSGATADAATKTKTKTKAKAKAKAKSKAKAKAGAKGKADDLEDDVTPQAKVKAKSKLVRKPKAAKKTAESVAAPDVGAGEAVQASGQADTATAVKIPAAEEKTIEATERPVKKARPAVLDELRVPKIIKPRPPDVPVKPKPSAVPEKKPAAAEPPKAASAVVEPPVKEKAPAAQPDLKPRPGERPARGKSRRGRKSPAEQEAQQRAVRESVRRTLAKMQTTRKTKRRKSKAGDEDVKHLPPVRIEDKSTVRVLADAFGVHVDEILEHCEDIGLEATPMTELDREMIELFAEEFGRVVHIEAVYGETLLKEEAEIDPARLCPRAPVVTVMGHVDHGKTSILDYIRKARVAAREAGGITQHIGAYEVEGPSGNITFIDTPGHEAFTAMRARGAGITDIVVLVVAADDGVMPQTIEAINHARAAEVPMVVAVNKIDVPGANPQNVKQQLMQQEVMVEAYGGEVVDVDVSAKTGEGIDKLLEMLLLQAELLELKADPGARAQGVVVETKKDEGRGVLTTVLVQQGTLSVGDVLVMGMEYAKVRSLIDYSGKAIKKALPGTPVQILGANGIAEPGDEFIAVKNEREAREISLKRKESVRRKELQPQQKVLSLEDLFEQIQQGEVKELNIVLKGDTNGSVEALKESLAPMEVEDVKVKVLHAAVGVVSESDVLLAQGASAIVIAFGAKVSPTAKKVAERTGVDIRAYNIIYEVISDIDLAMKGMLEPVFVERVLGRAEVRQLFKVTKLGTIAGSYVLNGSISRGASARVLREEEQIYDGKITSLKRFQEDVKEVAESFECGIGVSGYDALSEGDIIEAYVVEEKVRVF